MSLKMKGISIATTVCFVHGLAVRVGKVFAFSGVALRQGFLVTLLETWTMCCPIINVCL